MAADGEPPAALMCKTTRGLFFGILFRFAAFALRFEPLFLAVGAVGGALHQLGTDQLDHGLLGAIALAGSEARDAGVAAVALAEARAQRIEQLLHRRGRAQEQPPPAGACAACPRLASVIIFSTSGCTALALGTVVMTRSCSNHAGGQVAQQRVAAIDRPLQFVSGILCVSCATPRSGPAEPSSSGP